MKALVKCTYTNAKLQPDTSSLTIKNYSPQGTVIGKVIRTIIGTDGKPWHEIELLNCNRERTGWVRNDVVTLQEDKKQTTLLPWIAALLGSLFFIN